MTTTNNPAITGLLPIGARVLICADVHGDTVAGRIAGHVAYAHPHTPNGERMDIGYAVHLDRGAWLERDDLAPGARPWIGAILAHVDSVQLAEHQDAGA